MSESTFPLRFRVGVRTLATDIEDAHGDPAITWSDPVDHPVYGWGPPGAGGSDHGEPKLAGHDRVIVDRELLAPPGFPAGPRDRVVFPDGEFDVLGYPEDYTSGPFGYMPGLVVNCRRVEG